MLRAIYKTGSQLVFKHSNDKDYVRFYDTREERLLALIKHKRNDEADVHFALAVPKIFIGCYIYPFMELVQGEEIEEFKNFSLIDHKDEYIELVRNYVQWLPRENKKWYHIYLGISMLDRGTMELTDEQRENAQSIHDNGINDELYDYIIDYLFKV